MIKKSNKERLRDYFFLHPTASLRAREIEREAKLPLPSVTRYVQELLKEEILQEKIIGTTVFYAANRGNREYQRQKMLYNLRLLFDSHLVDSLIEELHNPPIRLFGSCSRGEDTEESDIDIYVQTPLKAHSLEKFEKILNKKIQLFVYKDIHDVENQELANNIMNGIPLHGYIEVLK